MVQAGGGDDEISIRGNGVLMQESDWDIRTTLRGSAGDKNVVLRVVRLSKQGRHIGQLSTPRIGSIQSILPARLHTLKH